eukprot:TRINITY_DN64857_c0_g1_i1.p1 TRINITY_DN64857_c0_g1~~TRINITY_DN64857_c0_g1_i1.p1  ORF type:complete len:538 (+),score=136.10 TRINITY_DN64857_c0_g1_i1:42-1616(+)
MALATTQTIAKAGQKSEHEIDRYPRFSTKKMTPEAVMAICQERNMWMQPHLNTQLFLNYKGFDSIDGLEDYTNIKSLHLGNNSISKIEGLDRMADLRSLHLEGNAIRVIEGLDFNLELRQLNLDGNAVRSISGLAHLKKLEHLSLSKNCIDSLEEMEALKSMENLQNLDISHNQVESGEGVVEFFASLPNTIRVLRYHGNPGIRFVEHYRKRMVNSLPELRYLDERPIFPVERRSCAAWAEGGLQAMQQAKKDHFKEKQAENRVDPERREFLTQQRKLAIARIEREDRERREQLQAAGIETLPESRVQTGDPEALQDYARKWQTKVNLHGLDGLRVQVAGEAAAAHGASAQQAEKAKAALAEAQRKASEAAARRTGALPSAEKVERHTAEPSHSESSSSMSFAPPSRRAAERRTMDTTDFMQSRKSASAEGKEEAFEDRQFALLGDDWTNAVPVANVGGNKAVNWQGQEAPKDKQADQVIPDLWKNNQEANKEEELRILDMNAKSSAVWNEESKGDSKDLSGLD